MPNSSPAKRLIGFPYSRLGTMVAGVACLLGSWSTWSTADVLLLNPRGQVEGELLNPQRQPQEDYKVRTKNNITITLSPKQVKKLVQDTLEKKRYDALLPKMPETATGNWKMAQWCGKNGLKQQRQFHLMQAIALDPEHELARRALGYVRMDDQWTLPAERMKQRGFIRHQGKWMLSQEIEILQRRKQYGQSVTDWKNQIKKWRNWLGGRRGEEAEENIAGISDPTAAGALANLLPAEKNVFVRQLYVRVLRRLGNETAVMALARATVEDENEEIRLMCLDALEQHGGKSAVPAFMERLGSSNNVLVRRSAVALARLGDERAVSALIDALVTEHKVKVGNRNPGSIGVGFGNSRAGNAGINSFSAGGRPRIVTIQNENQEVLDALVSLTDAANYGFQFDELVWRKWYSRNSTPSEINLRRIE